MRWLGVLCLALALASPAWAAKKPELPEVKGFEGEGFTADQVPKELKEVIALMSPENAFKANFLMSVYSKGSLRPTNTKGRFTFDNIKGLLVQIADPEKDALWINQEGIFRMDTKGKHHLSEDPGIFNKLREFFEGRMDELGREAKLSFGAQEKEWEVVVEPEGGALGGRVEQMRFRGSRGRLFWVRILEKDLTVTSIRLYNFQRYPYPLGDTEFFYLEPVQNFLP